MQLLSLQCTAVLTFAISPQLLPSSRILFRVCSSCADHGVFVLGFFLLPSSRKSAETGAPPLEEARGAGGGGSVFNGLLVGSGLADERGRLRGFDDAGGSRSTSTPECGGGGTSEEASSMMGLGEVPEGDDLCRF